MNILKVKNLYVKTKEKKILFGVDLTVGPGEVVALMGPNGSGKSTLANALMGHPHYKITKGQVMLGRRDILRLKPWQRSRAGMFLAFQYPQAVPGVSIYEFLQTACQAKNGKGFKIKEFEKQLSVNLKKLKLSAKFLDRSVNEGFSGGEKKKIEILQLLILKPEVAILDETDSGLDIDALQLVAKNIREMVNPDFGVLVITHYQRLLNYLKPDRVLVIINGRIIKSGGKELAKNLERKGYDWLK